MTAFESNMSSEFKRYATFSGFQAPSGVWPSQLAREGFCRLGTCDDHQVVCFSCGVTLDVRTIARKSLLEIHRRLSPNCAFVTGSSGNQPVPDVAVNAEVFSNLLQEMEISTQCYSHPCRRGMVPDGIDKYPFPAPCFPDDTLIPILNVPLLPSVGASNEADLTSVPMEVIDGLANTTLSSLPAAFLFGGAENSGLSQSADLFNFVQGGSGDDLEIDALGDGVEGNFPPVNQVLLQETLAEFATASQPVTTQTLAGEIASIAPAKKLDFDDLAIITHQPKNQNMCRLDDRLENLRSWVHQRIKQSNESLAEAGFYYAGYSDCCRCFHCGGGLKSWKDDDDPWVEHARFFKDCPFVLMSKGKVFVSAVQSLSKKTSISMDDVKAKMVQMTCCHHLTDDDVVDETFQDEMETADTDEAEQRLEKENDSLLEPELCKICMDKMVNVLYLPCAHLVTCSLCAPTVDKCPVCRQPIAGRVRVERTD